MGIEAGMAGRRHGSEEESGSVGRNVVISGIGGEWVMTGVSEGRGRFGVGEGVGSAMGPRK